MTPIERASLIVGPYRRFLGEKATDLEGIVADTLEQAHLCGITDIDWPATKAPTLCPGCWRASGGSGLCYDCCERVADGITEDGRMGAEGDEQP